MKADEKSGSAALAGELPANLRVWFSDPASADAYPIATFTWLLLYGKYDDAAKLDALKKFVKWGLTDGQKLAPELGYIPLPTSVVEKDMAASRRSSKDNSTGVSVSRLLQIWICFPVKLASSLQRTPKPEAHLSRCRAESPISSNTSAASPPLRPSPRWRG